MIQNVNNNHSIHLTQDPVSKSKISLSQYSIDQINTLQTLHESKFSLSKIFYTFLTPIKLIWNFITAPIRWTYNFVTRCCRPKSETIEQTKQEKFKAILKLIDAEKDACIDAFIDIEKMPRWALNPKKPTPPDQAKEQLRLHAQKGTELLKKAVEYSSNEEEIIQLHLRTMNFLVFLGSAGHRGCAHQVESGLDKLSGTPKEKFDKAYDIAMSQRWAIFPFEGKCNVQKTPYWESSEIQFYASYGLAFINKAFQYATSDQEKGKLNFELAVFSFFLGKEKEGSEYIAKARSLGFDQSRADSTERSFKKTIHQYRPKSKFFFW